jgi:hypothetical protein
MREVQSHSLPILPRGLPNFRKDSSILFQMLKTGDYTHCADHLFLGVSRATRKLLRFRSPFWEAAAIRTILTGRIVGKSERFLLVLTVYELAVYRP